MKKKFVKRLLTTLATCAMAIGIGTTAMAAQYGDVKEGAWYYESVQYVSDKGLMTGYASGNFGPADGLTRGQFATILYRMSGSPSVTYENFFPDVPNGVFYSEAVVWARNAGVITGYAGGNFGPQDPITREMMATILYRYEGSPGADQGLLASFPDAGNVSGFAKDGIAWAIGNAIITGDQGKINPQGRALRAHCATILYRYLGGNGQEGETTEPSNPEQPENPNTPEEPTTPGVDINSWADKNGFVYDNHTSGYKKTVDGVVYLCYLSTGGYTIAVDDGTAVSGKVEIPAEFDGIPVTFIGSNSFSTNKNITEIVIPGSITKIDGYAFNQCSNLKSFTFQGGVPDGFNKIIGIHDFTVYYPKDAAGWDSFRFLINSTSDSTTLVAY